MKCNKISANFLYFYSLILIRHLSLYFIWIKYRIFNYNINYNIIINEICKLLKNNIKEWFK